MPANRNALIRYKTIDLCLQNRYRKWALEDLMEACSEALYEYEGRNSEVSRRTIQLDLQMMRSDKLGYNAPIKVVDKKYYIYEDKNYSITNVPITEADLERVSETIEILKQFKGFSHFAEMESFVQRLEDYVYANKSQKKQVIDFEKNDNLKGLEYLDVLYKAIINNKVLKIEYQSFTARQAVIIELHPYLLKEFRNRWFVIGGKHNSNEILNLALDRIINITYSLNQYAVNQDFDALAYFQNVIGVTVDRNKRPEDILLFVHKKHAPYIETKPLHHSQKVVRRSRNGIVIRLLVQHNFELEKEILGFGDGMIVLSPLSLKSNIRNRLRNSLDTYQSLYSESELINCVANLRKQSFNTISNVYTGKEINDIWLILHRKLELIDKYGQAWLKSDVQSNGLFSTIFNLNICNIYDTLLMSYENTVLKIWHVGNKMDFSIREEENNDSVGYLFFLPTTKGESLSLNIVNPCITLKTNNEEAKADELNKLHKSCTLKSGDLLMFQSGLEITIDPSMPDSNSLVLVFKEVKD